jgi:RNA polymerase sigma-70 factor (ECF subfamily)
MAPSEIGYWFDEMSAGLVLYARQICGAGCEDVVQEVFVRFAGLPQTPSHPRAWLLAAVRNRALDERRSGRRRQRREHAAARLPIFEHSSEIAAGEVEEALAALALEEREVVSLRIWNGATFEDIAQITGMPLSSVYHKYRSALETMRARWEAPCRKK